MKVTRINPAGLPGSPSYSHAISVEGARELVFISGQVARDANGSIVGAGDLRLQAAKAYENLAIALVAAGSSPADLVKITTFVVGWRPEYLPVIHETRRSVFGPDFVPASSLIGVESLVDPSLLIEVEGIAVRP
jgi:enamine deaminase RidA (YjgF/YER057c/UK114 family)